MADAGFRARLLLISIVTVKLLLHMFTVRGYGYFRDEFYYIACSDQLALGYVDQPPLSILLLRLQRWLLGDSLPALRFLPARGTPARAHLRQQLRGETYEALRHRAFAEKRSVSAVIRDILRKDMAASRILTPSSIREFSFLASGRSKQGPFKPVSERHDDALAEVIGK